MEKLELEVKKLKNDKFIEEKSYDYLFDIGYDLRLKNKIK